MTALELLRKKLQIHNRDCLDVPAETEPEGDRRELQRMIIQLQIECEEWRHSIQMAFYMCTLKTVVEVFENLEIEKTKTVFNWEGLRDAQLNAIKEKELKGIHYLNQCIKHTYMTPKQKFETGLRFTIPKSDIVYKQVADHYGKNYIAFLNSGQWEFGMTITKVTEDALVYPDGEEQKEILFETMSFINQ